MRTIQWDGGKFWDNLRREAGRIDAAEFLSELERDTFYQLLAMLGFWADGRENGIHACLSDGELQPLRDWMEVIGAKMAASCRQRNIAHVVFPYFSVLSQAEAAALSESGGCQVYPFRKND